MEILEQAKIKELNLPDRAITSKREAAAFEKTAISTDDLRKVDPDTKGKGGYTPSELLVVRSVVSQGKQIGSLPVGVARYLKDEGLHPQVFELSHITRALRRSDNAHLKKLISLIDSSNSTTKVIQQDAEMVSDFLSQGGSLLAPFKINKGDVEFSHFYLIRQDRQSNLLVLDTSVGQNFDLLKRDLFNSLSAGGEIQLRYNNEEVRA